MEGSAWQDTPQSLRELDQHHPSPRSSRRRLHVCAKLPGKGEVVTQVLRSGTWSNGCLLYLEDLIFFLVLLANKLNVTSCICSFQNFQISSVLSHSYKFSELSNFFCTECSNFLLSFFAMLRVHHLL